MEQKGREEVSEDKKLSVCKLQWEYTLTFGSPCGTSTYRFSRHPIDKAIMIPLLLPTEKCPLSEH
jgi:hypothetical protein